jgi:hypothetical protein
VEIAIVIIVAVFVFGIIRRRNRGLSRTEIADLKQRIRKLEERANTQFVATPGDPRLKENWEYMTALKKPGEEFFTFTFFTKEGISHTQSDMADEAVDRLTKEGWHINGQTFNNQGMSWQLERPKPKSE